MDQQKVIRAGIIGLGGVGERVFQALRAHPAFQVAVLCDASEQRVKQAAETHRLAWTTDYRTILDDPAIDLIYVGVPPKFHHGIVMDVLKARKHVLCEKPLANSEEEAKEMSEAAASAGVVHAMNFPTYYRAAYAEMAKRIAEGFLGELKRVELKAHFHTWPRPWQQNHWIGGREQGGFIREVFPHFIHLIRAILGPIRDVNAHVQYPADPALCETAMFASAKLDGGVPVLFDGLSQIAQKENITFTMYGSQGTLSLQDWNVVKAGGMNEPLTEVPLPEIDRTLGLLDELAAAIRGEKARLVDFAEGYEIQQTLESLLRG
ncbi:Gfo/Idh/MocA family oxidoreductase [Cohnella pontilimi]|uniref:Gfo/Idh/MocA family oxidoreductase n=1 Tax=Cohnella pontilimi TaxID=2564100 RepID=A0A4V5LSF0_9BACL|nr:Gfo/Idh/MocA family oxidoreductase [Cohnella pontilimi]TJY42829.1 Gfo/Idh/MocA family oxidoreductase [Cohnella pontilimi]